ncbi:hypothetical protein [Algoriphagus chordae]|uniref:Glycosyltransferase RgtA/B/C/D-like domain-containing protein n=1 Tax=Algoriphagus chordae TaxID=237019 RepID=A0A2W7R0R4_9BACT|nr:hypothetical protein [Algoriphagus chordae]PZX47659.1 hypothetical protein LV85_03849 [Algoriphagus chordae]
MNKILAGCTVLSLLLIFFGINRGFDISDEGLYALLAVPDQENIAGIFNYDLFFKLFYKITEIEFGIVGLRGLRLFFYLSAAISLTFFWKNLAGASKLLIDHFLLSLLGLFAGYGFLPQSLSYNSLSVVLVCFWLALISLKDRSIIQHVLIGLVLAGLAYVKITACLGLGLLTLAWMILGNKVKLLSLLSLVLPFAAVEMLLYFVLDDYALSRMVEATHMMGNRNEYSFLLLLKYSAVGFFWLALVSIPFLISSAIRTSRPKLASLILVLGLFILVWIAYATTITGEWNHVVLLSTVAILAFFAPRLPFAAISTNQRFLALVLLVLPFVLHFGSNVYLLRLGIHYWVFWLLAAFYMCSLLHVKFLKYIRASVGIVTVLLVANGIWIHPFEQEALWNATEEWSYGKESQIKLSKNQIDLLNIMEPLLNDEEELLAFYRIPGIPYLLGKTSPKSPGFWTKSQVAFYFPNGISDNLIINHPHNSLPLGLDSNYHKKMFSMPNGEQLQVLWRD